jgi:DMSO/TMAO reductase YedYZ molybdopterin-dependent catalytic subunit
MTRVIYLVAKRWKIQMQKKLTLTITIITAISLLLIASAPSTTAANGDLQITNLSGTQFIFTYYQLLATPKAYSYADLLCYGDLVTTGNWGGIQLSYLLAQANLTQETGSVQFLASDGYKVTIPIDLAMQPQVILAYEKDSQPLSDGYRLVLPDLNGAAWIAQITSLSMLASGANYPEVASAGGGSLSGKSPQLNNPTATPQPTPSQTQPPTPQPTPTNVPHIQTANTTQPPQPTPTPQTTNANLTSQTILLYAIASASAVSLAATVTVAIKRKAKKLK